MAYLQKKVVPKSLITPNKMLAPAGLAIAGVTLLQGFFASRIIPSFAPYMMIGFSIGGGNHAIAVAISHFQIDFFDPNYGSVQFRKIDRFTEWFQRTYVRGSTQEFEIFPCGGEFRVVAGSSVGSVMSQEERRAKLASLLGQTVSSALRPALHTGLMPGPPPLLSAKQTQSPPPMLSARPQMQGPPPPLSARPSMQGPPPLLSSLNKAK